MLLGYQGKAYYLPTGPRATWGTQDATTGVCSGPIPTGLALVASQGDVTVSISKDKAKVDTRDNNGWHATAAALKGAVMKFKVIYDATKASHIALIAATILDNATIAIVSLDQPDTVVGAQGLWADWTITDMEKGEPLEEAQTLDFTLEPALTSVPPQWVKVSAS